MTGGGADAEVPEFVVAPGDHGAVGTQRQRMVASAGDRDRVGEAGDLHRQAAIGGGAVAQDAPLVEAPAPHAAVGGQCHRVVMAGADRLDHGVSGNAHLGRAGAVGLGAVADLAVLVVPPAPHAAGGIQGHHVLTATVQVDNVCKHRRPGSGMRGGGAVAELAVGVVPPGVHIGAGREGRCLLKEQSSSRERQTCGRASPRENPCVSSPFPTTSMSQSRGSSLHRGGGRFQTLTTTRRRVHKTECCEPGPGWLGVWETKAAPFHRQTSRRVGPFGAWKRCRLRESSPTRNGLPTVFPSCSQSYQQMDLCGRQGGGERVCEHLAPASQSSRAAVSSGVWLAPVGFGQTPSPRVYAGRGCPNHVRHRTASLRRESCARPQRWPAGRAGRGRIWPRRCRTHD